MADDRGTARSAALTRLLLGAAALLGLLAMHGLGVHGTAHDSAPAAHGPHAAADPGGPAASSSLDAVGDPMSHESDTSLLGLCLAVLGVALLGLFGVGRAGRRPWIRLRLRDLRIAVSAVSSRDRDPPCLHLLSIQRC